ncbi:hypothetical protein KIL84_001983 [Mauremys mutica]|uniref:Ig-like domain-containing protein n=1 Tax=Mauremys mutica TaxID=74926 RepID=A0A9D4B5F2_9SAUR|nr:hypothetical protein KIL84_001983 [Mauremys mutica]
MHLGIKILSISSVPLLFVLKWFWDDFTVTVDVNPAVVLVGQAVTLSCHLIGQVPTNIQVHWYKLERNKNTTLYFYNSTEKGTELFQAGDRQRIKGRYENGDVKVKFFPEQVEDSGQYVCAAKSDGVYQEAITQVIVAGFGSAPHLTIEHQQNNSTTLRCVSQGWHPQPEVRWTDSTGQNITAMAETRIQKDVTELYQIHSTLRVAETVSDTISCTIINPLLKRHRKKVIAISGFFDVEAEHDVITAIIGENAILPCRLITKHLPPSMELQWRKVGPGKDKTIYFYLYDESSPLVNTYPRDDKCSMGYLSPNGVNSREWLRKKYEKKAEVFKGKEFGKGNISLQLNNMQVEDEGKYVCSATANSFHREIITDVLVIGDLEKRMKEPREQMGDLEKIIREMEKTISALPAPTLYLSQTSARPGDSMQLQCSVLSQFLVTGVIFCKDGEEVLSQRGLEQKAIYDYSHVVSGGSSGNYSCGYEIKDSKNWVKRSQLSPAQRLRVTGNESSMTPATLLKIILNVRAFVEYWGYRGHVHMREKGGVWQ